mmetsp:Transcript_68154/g.160312  ORF Transcript_68154/g.160312 Transcript_68154/m.160312 type:complete len:139 (-) Transcript_68154:126-542(-)|eukprot:CAMPEP_0175897720 /NCGR_PEP_ID=MMETSP0108-20121206/869_1 /TAXON_ID=195067 ORGANISM="Goniomonas pacifica, Strain CCMP1869" /NCGR_SAMPLE_ID=MMETSP0108 /ASSEMBLY_ACC=CAM_ASM_000204 /LENGTH=138 /DNA_ID=CAMNT_0017219035 /DNA_START=244 /DNA_END=660 /DNA_ORIENTATION=+
MKLHGFGEMDDSQRHIRKWSLRCHRDKADWALLLLRSLRKATKRTLSARSTQCVRETHAAIREIDPAAWNKEGLRPGVRGCFRRASERCIHELSWHQALATCVSKTSSRRYNQWRRRVRTRVLHFLIFRSKQSDHKFT